jgi:hypothetical protein
MTKSQVPFAHRHSLEFTFSVLIALALVGCGTQTGAGAGANGPAIEAAPFCVAPVEGSPEGAAMARGHCPSYFSHVAPVEGSPEQTAAELGR